MTTKNSSVFVPFVDLSQQHELLRQEFHEALDDVLESSQFTLGDILEQFEMAFAAKCQARFGVGVGTGLDALTLSLRAMGVQSGDEIIVPANTFIATVLAVLAVGAIPRFVDVDPVSKLVTADLIDSVVTTRTAGIIPVHLYGRVCDLDQINQLAVRRNLFVLEDAAQAHGIQVAGTAAFSFYPSKNLGALGDGGMIVTNSELLAKRLRTLRNYGQQTKYNHVVLGTNSRLDPLQAAFLLKKLPRLDEWNHRRFMHARYYRYQLQSVQTPPAHDIVHLFVVETDHRDDCVAHLENAGIGWGIHYPIPAYRAPFLNTKEIFPVTDRAAARSLSLPLFPEMTADQRDYVIDTLNSWRTACD